MRSSLTLCGFVAATVIVATEAAAAPTPTGPSSSQSPYLVPTQHGVVTTSILTVGDAADNGYRLVGVPDGLGAFDNGDGTFTLLVNHELPPIAGVVREHGFVGAFVSRWTIDIETLQVLAGEDLAKRVYTPNAAGGWSPLTTPLNRLCSADLPGPNAFYDAASGAGTTHRLFLNGEEAGMGRAFAHVVDGPDAGSSYRLTALGRSAWENQVTLPGTGVNTVVVGTNDEVGGQVYVYVGQKSATGNDVERAGLTGGKLYGVRITGVADETDASTVPADGAAFSLVEIPGAATMTPAQLDVASDALGVSRMARPEDSAADPTDPGGLYFASTAGFTATSRLWHLRFSDLSDVTAGGVAEIAVASPPYDAAEPAGPRMMDNLTVNSRGQVLIQEDTGNQPYLSGVFQYDPSSGTTQRVAQHDPARFLGPVRPGFLTEQEETSGIIPAPFLGAGKYLLTSQAHYPTGDAETFQGGQLLVMNIPPGKPVS